MANIKMEKVMCPVESCTWVHWDKYDIKPNVAANAVRMKIHMDNVHLNMPSLAPMNPKRVPVLPVKMPANEPTWEDLDDKIELHKRGPEVLDKPTFSDMMSVGDKNMAALDEMFAEINSELTVEKAPNVEAYQRQVRILEDRFDARQAKFEAEELAAKAAKDPLKEQEEELYALMKAHGVETLDLVKTGKQIEEFQKIENIYEKASAILPEVLRAERILRAEEVQKLETSTTTPTSRTASTTSPTAPWGLGWPRSPDHSSKVMDNTTKDTNDEDLLAVMKIQKLAMSKKFVENYVVSEKDHNGRINYKVNLSFGDESYEGEGISVNAAKQSAACKALANTKHVGNDEKDEERETYPDEEWTEVLESIENDLICIPDDKESDASEDDASPKKPVYTKDEVHELDFTSNKLQFEIKSVEELTIGNAKITIESECVARGASLFKPGQKKGSTNADNDYLKIKVVAADDYGKDHCKEIHFKVKQNTLIGKIRSSYSERVGISMNSLKFLYEGVRIKDDDTPSSLNMNEDDSIEVIREYKSKIGVLPNTQALTEYVKYLKITFKINVQFLVEKPKLFFNVQVGMSYTLKKVKENVLKHLAGIYKEKVTVAFENFVFLFDNAYVEDDATPIGLAMEKEDIIEVFENPNKKLVTEFLSSTHTPRKIVGEYIQGINVALDPARVIHNPDEASNPEFHHSSPELALVCKEQLVCIKESLLPELDKIIQTHKPFFPADTKLPDFAKIGFHLSEDRYVHSVDCMKEVKEVLRRFEMATEYFVLLQDNEQAKNINSRKELSRYLKKCFKDITKKMPQEGHADEDPDSANLKIFIGPSRNATPENFLQARPILEVMDVGRCTKFQDLANTYFDAANIPISNFVMRYNNKPVDPAGLVLEALELLLKNHYIVIEILGQIEDTRDIDSLVDFIEKGSDEGKKKKKKNKKKKVLANDPYFEILSNPEKKHWRQGEHYLNGVPLGTEQNKVNLNKNKVVIQEEEESKVTYVNKKVVTANMNKEIKPTLSGKDQNRENAIAVEKVEETAILTKEELVPNGFNIVKWMPKLDEAYEKLLTYDTYEQLTPLLRSLLFEEYAEFMEKAISLDLLEEDIPALCENNVGVQKLKQVDVDYFLKRKKNINFVALKNPGFDIKKDRKEEYIKRFYLVKNYISVTPENVTIKLSDVDISNIRANMQPCMEVLKIPIGDMSHKNETSLLRSFENVCWPMASWFQWVANIYQGNKETVKHPKFASFQFDTNKFVKDVKAARLQFQLLGLLLSPYNYMKFDDPENEVLIEAIENAYTSRLSFEKQDVDSLVDFIESKDKKVEIKEVLPAKGKKKTNEKASVRKKKEEAKQYFARYSEDLNGGDFTNKAQMHFMKKAQSELLKRIFPNTDEATWLEIAAMKAFMVIETQANIELTVYSLFPNENWCFKATFEELFKVLYGDDDKNFKCRKLKENTLEAKLTALIELGEKDGQSIGIETPAITEQSTYETMMYKVFLKHFEREHKKDLEKAKHASAIKILKGAAERAVVCFSKGIGIRLEIESLHKGLGFCYTRTFMEVRDDLQKYEAEEKKKKGKDKTGKKAQSRKQKSASPVESKPSTKATKEDIGDKVPSAVKAEEIEPEKSKSVQVEEGLTIEEKIKQLETEMKSVDVALATSKQAREEVTSGRQNNLEQLIQTQQLTRDEEVKNDNEIEEATKWLERLNQRKQELASSQTELVRLVTECETTGKEQDKYFDKEEERLLAAKDALDKNLQTVKKMLPEKSVDIETSSSSESPEDRSDSPSTSSADAVDQLSASNKLLDHLEKTIKRYSKDLECPVCLITVSAPAFKCEEEHLVCAKCRPKVKNCPVCRIPYNGAPRRHRYAEKDLEELNRLIQERNDITGSKSN